MRICIFGAASNEIDAAYMDGTYALARALAERGHTLMFGGGANGLMGAAARGFTDGGGHIIGVAPGFFNVPGVLYEKCDAFVYTETMQERKKYMEDHSEAFIAVPGGIGTYEEIFEVLTLKSLGRHGKPIVLFNLNGFYNDLVRLLKDGVQKGFIRENVLPMIACTADIAEAVRLTEAGETDTSDAKIYG
jgi:uncharacterized protein (TIGR00730 family)